MIKIHQQWRGSSSGVKSSSSNNQLHRRHGRSCCYLKLKGMLWVVAILSVIISVRLLQTISSSPDESSGSISSSSTLAVSPMKNNNNKEDDIDSAGVRFVLFLGLEGVGHHFWQDLIKGSPLFDQLQKIGLHPNYTKKLTQRLYSHKKNRFRGLWSATCQWETEDNKQLFPNITNIQDNLIETLRNINNHHRHVINNADRQSENNVDDSKQQPVTTYFPINLLPGGGNEFGVISYPGFLKPCRSLNYPNLDVFYDTCTRAGVICQHIYLYRNPFDVLKSTTINRKFNKNIMEAIHLYTTQLRILHSQLLQFSNKIIGCWNYDDVVELSLSTTSTETHKERQYLLFEQEIETILQFDSPKIFYDVLKKIFKNPTTQTNNNNNNNRDDIVPIELNSYMKSMITIHDEVVRTCHNFKKSKIS